MATSEELHADSRRRSEGAAPGWADGDNLTIAARGHAQARPL